MVEKYILRYGDHAIAIKRNDKTKMVTIGGLVRYSEFMESFIKEYFRKGLPKRRYTQVNKIRYTFIMGWDSFHSSRDRLEEHGFEITKVDSLGRIMR